MKSQNHSNAAIKIKYHTWHCFLFEYILAIVDDIVVLLQHC